MFSQIIEELRVEAQKTIKTNTALLSDFEKADKQRMARRVSGQTIKDSVLSVSIGLAGVAGLGFVASALTGGAASAYPALVAAGATIGSAAGFLLQSVMPIDIDRGIGAVNSLERKLALDAAVAPGDKEAVALRDLLRGAKQLVSKRVDALVSSMHMEEDGVAQALDQVAYLASLRPNGLVERVEIEPNHQEKLDQSSKTIRDLNNFGMPLTKIAVVTTGSYSGRIMGISDGLVIQRTHPSGTTVTHSLARLSAAVAEGEVVNIGYKNGQGLVRERPRELTR